jgi:hypothetical protein
LLENIIIKSLWNCLLTIETRRRKEKEKIVPRKSDGKAYLKELI